VYTGTDGITRVIEIAPIDYDRHTNQQTGSVSFVKRQVPEFVFYLVAWKDENMRRRIWHKNFERRTTLPHPREIGVILQQMLDLVSTIGESDLR
jgi:hypothetical protein